jgi:hypothetical protein
VAEQSPNKMATVSTGEAFPNGSDDNDSNNAAGLSQGDSFAPIGEAPTDEQNSWMQQVKADNQADLHRTTTTTIVTAYPPHQSPSLSPTIRNPIEAQMTSTTPMNQCDDPDTDRYTALEENGTETVTSPSASIHSKPSNVSMEDASMQGGRLWHLAAQQAETTTRGQQFITNPTATPSSSSAQPGPGARLAETFMERTRSRADPDALVASPSGQKKMDRE